MPLLFRIPPAEVRALVTRERPMLEFVPLGSTEPNCPSCSATLAKLPARRTTCKACGQAMVKRTRLDRTQVVATEADGAKLDAQKLIATMGVDIINEWQTIVARARASLGPSGDNAAFQDVCWRILEHDAAASLNYANRGPHRNVRAEMAGWKRDAGDDHAALAFYVEVLCWDMTTFSGDLDRIEDFRNIAKSPHHGDMNSSHTGDVDELAQKLTIDDETLKSIFAARTNLVRKVVPGAPALDVVWSTFVSARKDRRRILRKKTV